MNRKKQHKMKTFIAFFDVLGFKEFINKNDLTEVRRLFNQLLRDSQTAICGQKYIQVNQGVTVPDLKHQTVNCLHVSDNIIFWTNNDSEKDFKDLVEVCYFFYWRSLQTTFPLRGCLTYGEIDFNPYTKTNENGIEFYNYSLIGKGLVDAYLKSDNIEYAGCLLDKLAVDKAGSDLVNSLIYEQKICVYKVPHKNGDDYEYVFRPIKGDLNEISFGNTVKAIKELFTYASKAELTNMPESVKKKLINTIDFFSFFRETDEPLIKE